MQKKTTTHNWTKRVLPGKTLVLRKQCFFFYYDSLLLLSWLLFKTFISLTSYKLLRCGKRISPAFCHFVFICATAFKSFMWAIWIGLSTHRLFYIYSHSHSYFFMEIAPTNLCDSLHLAFWIIQPLWRTLLFPATHTRHVVKDKIASSWPSQSMHTFIIQLELRVKTARSLLLGEIRTWGEGREGTKWNKTHQKNMLLNL